MIYLIFNEGYSATADPEQAGGAPSCDEAIRLGAADAAHLSRRAGADGAAFADAAADLPPRRRASMPKARSCCSRIRTAQLWNQQFINEALALLDKALRHRKPGPYQVQAAIAAVHSRAKRAEDTDWEEIDLLYRALERIQPSPVVTLNRAVAVSKLRGPAGGARPHRAARRKARRLFLLSTACSGNLLMQLGRIAQARDRLRPRDCTCQFGCGSAHIRRQIDKMQEEAERSVVK